MKEANYGIIVCLFSFEVKKYYIQNSVSYHKSDRSIACADAMNRVPTCCILVMALWGYFCENLKKAFLLLICHLIFLYLHPLSTTTVNLLTPESA